MKKFFKNVLYSGIQDSLGPEEQVKLLFINSIIFLGMAVLTVFGIRDITGGNLVLGGVTLAIDAIVLGLYFTIRTTKNYLIGVWFLPFFMFAFYSYLTASGGAGSTTVLWMLTYPSFAVFLAGTVWGAVFSGAFLLVQLALLFVPGLSPAWGIELEYKLRLAGVYAILFTFSLAFETIRMKAQRELASTAAELAAAKVQTDGILKNVNEGIFLLDPELTIGDHHSLSLAGLLQVEAPAGRTLPDLLRGRIEDRNLNACRDYLSMFFMPTPPWHLMEDINPLSEVAVATADGTERHLTFAFGPVELSTGRRVLGTVRDVTQAWELGQKLKQEEDRSARQMKHLFQIIHVKPELLLQFLQDADEEIAAINRRLKDPKSDPVTLVEELFQGVHSVKGNAALVGLVSFADRVHDLETTIDSFRTKKPVWQDFLEMTVRLSIIQAELTEIRELLDRMAAFQRGLEASVGGKDLLLLALEKAVDRLGQDTGLGVDLDTSLFPTEIVPEKHRKLIRDVLIQLVRNSFAHGFEPTSERRASGKHTRARIKVAVTPADQHLTLAYWDDGRGLDPQRLRQAARTLPSWGGRDPGSLTDAQALELAFAPGLSTTATPGLHAGRGVGLGLVKERVEAAGGRLRLRSVPGKGVAFDITLPIT